MPIVQHSRLPTFERLRDSGHEVLTLERALHQDIRELHIGFLNMMPDAALEATERQFIRLVGGCNRIAQFFVYPFSLDGLPRSAATRDYIDRYYSRFDELRDSGLDALIITGANVANPALEDEPFWDPLMAVVDWARDNVASTLCSCLATHAVLKRFYGIDRRPLPEKRWGVYDHRVCWPGHPLLAGINTRFDVPHSRWNAVTRQQFEEAGLRVLVEVEGDGVHLATSADGLRVVFFQGHPEYDTISLLKEYKREVGLYADGARADYPPFPVDYFGVREKALLNEHRSRVDAARLRGVEIPAFPEQLVAQRLDNTWHDTAEAVVGNWMGLIYQVTHDGRRIPFMAGINPDDPLGLYGE